MTKGRLVKWLKDEGGEIKTSDVICDIETDKATLGYESLDDGFLAKILIGNDTKDIPVGQVIGIMVDEKSDIDKFKDFTLEDAGGAPT